MLLNEEWKRLLRDYREYHDHPICEATHVVGIPMIAVSIPAMIVPPVGMTLFTWGWILQFVGHYFKGNPPKFFGDKRNLIVGAIWWLDTVLRPTGLNRTLFGDTDAAEGAEGADGASAVDAAGHRDEHDAPRAEPGARPRGTRRSNGHSATDASAG